MGDGCGNAFFFKVFDMELDSLPYQLDHLVPGLGRGDTAGQVGNVGAIARGTVFDDDQILHTGLPISNPPV